MTEKQRFIILICLLGLSIALLIVLNTTLGQQVVVQSR